jgi:RHS repeat-associated protein
LEYNGNQVVKVTDGYGSRNQYAVKEYQDKADKAVEFAYDANGNMVKDLDRNIVAIRYNLLNLPDTVQFANGNQIINRYDASGRKLGSRSMTLVTPLVTPVSEGTILGGVDVNAEDDVTASGTDYVGNVEYTVTRIYDFDVTERPVEYYSLSRLYNPEGYPENITTGTKIPVYSYYSKDHLGNNREVWRAAYYRGTKYNAAAVTQRMQYYPGGLPWSESLNPDAQKRKYNGKEFIEINGYDMYDYEARGMYPALVRFTTVDPMAEKYYSISPYVYCAGNPVNAVDPTGEYSLASTYVSQDGTIIYHLNDDDNRIYIVPDPIIWDGERDGLEVYGYERIGINYESNIGRNIKDVGFTLFPQSSLKEEPLELDFTIEGLFFSAVRLFKFSKFLWPTNNVKIPKNIVNNKQGKHILGHKNYIKGRSILKRDPQYLLNKVRSKDVKSITKNQRTEN